MLPAELLIKIFDYAAGDITSRLPDGFFRALEIHLIAGEVIHDHTFAYVRRPNPHTGLANLLLINRQLSADIAKCLYREAVHVVLFVPDPEGHQSFGSGCPYGEPCIYRAMMKKLPFQMEYIAHLKINVRLADTPDLHESLVEQINVLFEAVKYGRNLESLQIYISGCFRSTCQQIMDIFNAFRKLQSPARIEGWFNTPFHDSTSGSEIRKQFGMLMAEVGGKDMGALAADMLVPKTPLGPERAKTWRELFGLD